VPHLEGSFPLLDPRPVRVHNKAQYYTELIHVDCFNTDVIPSVDPFQVMLMGGQRRKGSVKKFPTFMEPKYSLLCPLET
jgi:hypothetical protein